MGMFSWLTADTDVSISSSHNAMPPVYLLQPGGKEPIMEELYDGYGHFGGVDAYEWLAKENLSPELLKAYLDDSPRNELRVLGIGLEMGRYFYCPETGDNWVVFHVGYAWLLPNAKAHYGTYEEIIEGFGASANDLIKTGRFVEKRFSDSVRYPLKFSFNPKAKYEDLPASEGCENQGFLYEVDEYQSLETIYEKISLGGFYG